MISVDLKKSDSIVPSLAKLSIPDEEIKLSFSELLKGFSSKTDDKLTQNGSLVLNLQTSKVELQNDSNENQLSKTLNIPNTKENLLSLLKNDLAGSEESKEILAINPKLSDSLSINDMKRLIVDAKTYLKDKITQTDGYKNLEIKELPKTLNGLISVAKRFDIDVSKISFSEVKSKGYESTNIKEILKTPIAIFNEVKSDEKVTATKALESMLRVTPDKKLENVELAKDVKIPNKAESVELAKDVKIPTKTENTEIPKDVKIPNKTENVELAKDVKIPNKAENIELAKDLKIPNKAENVELAKDLKIPNKAENVELAKDLKIPNKAENVEIPRDLKLDRNLQHKSIPNETQVLSKTQTKTEHTTQEIVQIKQSKNDETPQKIKVNETLSSLLRGKKIAKETGLSADFSVNSAKVIAPSLTQTNKSELTKGLESLLGTEQSESSSTSKLDNTITTKAENLEVKVRVQEAQASIKEAKHMISYLSSDVKTAIEDYKSPFTRIKVQLNPQQLGEVDLTVVQRGKNLHVNIGSNNTAINTLSMNISELRVQLSNSGINNATFNFNNSPSQGDSNAGGQQQNNSQEQQQARKEYDYFEKEDSNEEILSSLEIVVPNYA